MAEKVVKTQNSKFPVSVTGDCTIFGTQEVTSDLGLGSGFPWVLQFPDQNSMENRDLAIY